MACIVVDEALKRGSGGKAHLAPLAVGLGIYLPLNSTLTIVVGAVAGWLFERAAERKRDPEATKQLGVLMASDGLEQLMDRAVTAARRRSEELGRG